MSPDINGSHSPNKFGVDLFLFVLKEDGLYPAGCDMPNYCGNKAKTYNGLACTCKVIQEKAMNY